MSIFLVKKNEIFLTEIFRGVLSLSRNDKLWKIIENKVRIRCKKFVNEM